MRWFLLASLVLAAGLEGLWLVDQPVAGVKLPVFWLVLFLVMSQGWVGWRQGLLMAAVGSFVLDCLASPMPGVVMIGHLLAWLIAVIILEKGGFSRDAKIGSFAAGTTLIMLESLTLGLYWPGWKLVGYWAVFVAAAAIAMSMVRWAALKWIKPA